MRVRKPERPKGRAPASQPGSASRAYRKFPTGSQGRRALRSTPQRVDERRFQVLELLRRALGGTPEEALDEDPVERADDQSGFQLRANGRPERALLAPVVDDVGEQVAVHALKLVQVRDQVVRMLFLPQHEAQEELD